ncbi:hypothetical protein D1007_32253 [Hordeum vulgare]|nr:hypothetical protein D1007_32253 [Hordeum vulgare]
MDVLVHGVEGDEYLDLLTENDTLMNSTQDPASRRSSTIQRQLVRDASGNVHTSEERDDAHDSFLQVKKGSVLLTRMESITTYKNQHGQRRSGKRTQDQSDTPVSANDMCALEEWSSHARGNRAQLQDEAGGQKKKGRGVLKGFKASKKRFVNGSAKLNIAFSEKLGGTVGMNYRSFKDDVDKTCEEVKNKETETQGPLSDEQRHNIFQTTYKGTLQCKSSQPRGYGYMAKPSTGSERIRIQIEVQARATAAFGQQNSELSHQGNDLQDQLQAERANTQEIINLERAEREQLEGELKEERAEREILLEEERTSRLKFEKKHDGKVCRIQQKDGNPTGVYEQD